MKAKDLMIGDLVRVNRDVCIKNDTIVRVCGIDATNRLVEKGLEGSATCVPVDDIDFYSRGIWVKYLSPIPLTSEILKKNGFENVSVITVGTAKMRWVSEDTRTEITIWMDDTLPMEIVKNVYYEDEVSYTLPFPGTVHQLQHALRLCGIDKEIIVC